MVPVHSSTHDCRERRFGHTVGHANTCSVQANKEFIHILIPGGVPPPPPGMKEIYTLLLSRCFRLVCSCAWLHDMACKQTAMLPSWLQCIWQSRASRVCCTRLTHVPPACCTQCAAWEGGGRLLVAPLCPQMLCTDPTLAFMACKVPASHPMNSPACMQHPVQCRMQPAVHACMPLTCAQLCRLHDADCVA
jgi:hypothetical protein